MKDRTTAREILYIGNFLESHGQNPNFNRFLIEKFDQHFDVSFASEKKNRALRLIDMLGCVWASRARAGVVVIDCFSTSAFWFAYFTAQLCRLVGLPYVTLLRGGNLLQRLDRSPGFCRAVFSHAATNVSPSLYLQRTFEGRGFRVEYIPNFIDIENYSFKERLVFRPRMLWVRSFHEVYNPTLAVDILHLLKAKHADAALCMVGPDKDGSLRKTKQRALELGVESCLTITGRLEKSDWIRIASDYDIFINTTDFDNHPVSVIETMALGLPLVSTNVGGLPYLIENGHDGILVPPQDAKAFVIAIEDLLENPVKALQLAREARRKAEGLDWGTVKSKWLTLLSSTMRPTV